MRRTLAVLVLILTSAAASRAQDRPPKPAPAKEKGYLGAYLTVSERGGARVLDIPAVVRGSPAAAAGLMRGDIVVAVEDRRDLSADAALQRLRELLVERGPGGELRLTIRRLQTFVLETRDGVKRLREALPELEAALPGEGSLELKVERRQVEEVVRLRLGHRPGQATPPQPLKALMPAWAARTPEGEERLAGRVIEAAGLAVREAALLRRIEDDERGADAFRLPSLSYLRRSPRSAAPIARSLGAEIDRGLAAEDPRSVLVATAPISSAAVFDFEPGPAPPPGSGLEAHLDYIKGRIRTARIFRDRSLRRLSLAQRRALRAALPSLLSRLEEEIYLHTDPDEERWRRNTEALELLALVDRDQLLTASRLLLALADRRYLTVLRQDLLRVFGAEARGALYSKVEDFGPVLITGVGGRKQSAHRPALLIDLGGDDAYLGMEGAADGEARPVAVVLELGGDDRYQSLTPGRVGAGVLGLGLIADLSGDDVYLSTGALSQGAAFAGAGLLVDWCGRDDYTGGMASQGAALVAGLALHWDGGGDDRYAARALGQGFGGPGGLGLCLSQGGDDRYLGGVGRPSSYGDTGVTFGFCQGVGMGFRGLASGGLGLFVDRGGADRYIAGDFSQGGGYAFAMGMMFDLGEGGDRYRGSRYAQGFSAHSAGGVFWDAGGEDQYSGLVGALQGAAWDLSFAVFLDDDGADRYQGEGGFNLGASAHNGWCLFVDRGGADRFRAGVAWGAAGPNSYHGGESLSLFLLGGPEPRRGGPKRARGARSAWSGSGRGLWLQPGRALASLSDKEWTALRPSGR